MIIKKSTAVLVSKVQAERHLKRLGHCLMQVMSGSLDAFAIFTLYFLDPSGFCSDYRGDIFFSSLRAAHHAFQ